MSEKKISRKCLRCGEPLEPEMDKCPKCGSTDKAIALKDEGIGQEVAQISFVDSLRNAYDKSSEEQKKGLKTEMKKALEDFCMADIDAKVDRCLEPPSIGVIDVTNTNFTQILGESLMCYVYGFYYSTISVCGITAERLCMDILLRRKLTIDERILLSEDLNSLFAIPYSHMIELLYGWHIINENIKNKLHRIKDIRNKYVHPDVISNLGQLKKDSLEILTLLKDVLSQSFPRSSDMPPVHPEI
jgi:hypothetical protein